MTKKLLGKFGIGESVRLPLCALLIGLYTSCKLKENGEKTKLKQCSNKSRKSKNLIHFYSFREKLLLKLNNIAITYKRTFSFAHSRVDG